MDSPAWKNPREVLQRFRVGGRQSKRRLLVGCPDAASACSSNSQPTVGAQSAGRPKRVNPFKRLSPRKKVHRVASAQHLARMYGDSDSSLCEALESQDTRGADSSFGSNASLSSVGLPTDFRSLALDSSASPAPSPPAAPLRSAVLPPLDLRLSSRLRFTVAAPFPWLVAEKENLHGKCDLLPTPTEKAAALDFGVCGQLLTKTRCDQLENLTVDAKALVLGCAHYWVYPCLPWIDEFPRIERKQRLAATREQKAASIATLGSTLSLSLLNEWKSRFNGLFDLLVSGSVKLFYVCCPNFTIAFVHLSDGARAVITPTTSALRQILRDRGIRLETPLRSGSRRSSRDRGGDGGSLGGADEVTQSQPPMFFGSCAGAVDTQSCQEAAVSARLDDDDEEEDELNTSGEANDGWQWLSEKGFSPATMAKLKRSSSQSDRSSKGSARSSLSTEDAAKSAAVVGADHLAALRDFVRDERHCQALIGAQAGLPPTLLSAAPFVGASLKTLSTQVRQQKGGADGAARWSLEFWGGPILPNVAAVVSQLLERSACGRVLRSASGQTPYQGLNCVRAEPATDADPPDNGCSFDELLVSSAFVDASELLFEGVYRYQ